MKILILHTFYQIKGGEDSVFTQEKSLIEKEHEVKEISFQNKSGLVGAFQFLFSIWNIVAAKKLKRMLISFKPDIVHIHNMHFGIGPIAIITAKNLGIPVVVTLHNYRLLCPSGILQHKGHLFTNSLHSNFPWKAVRYKVYRSSYLQTFWLAFCNWFHKKIKTWNKVDRYIVLTDFAKELLLNSNLEIMKDQVVVKPNFVSSNSIMQKDRAENFLFVGRLMEEKGILLLLNTFKDLDLKLEIAGSGPLINEVLEVCKNNDNIEYLGNLNKIEVLNAMKKCSALIFPSTWFEGMPMTILEAFSLGTPVISSNIGAMKTMIDHEVNGLHFETGNTNDLKKTVQKWFYLSDDSKQSFRTSAYLSFKEKYSENKNKTELFQIYQSLSTK